MYTNEMLSKYDQIITEQKSAIKIIDNLTELAEQMLFELKIRNGGNLNVQN